MIPALALLAGFAAAQHKVVAPVPLGPIAPALVPVPAIALPPSVLPLAPGGLALQAPSVLAPVPQASADLEAAVADGKGSFDGARAGVGTLATAKGGRSAPKRWPGWNRGRFESPADGIPLEFRWRPAAQPSKRPVRVFVGGMALADSFEPYFEAAPAKMTQYVLVPRGLPPSPWAVSKPQLDADARDLARMIVLAARGQAASSVELVLHSYAAFSFQRMLQLASDPEIASAVELLRGGRVVWIGGTTHWRGSEATLGREFELAAHNARMLVAFIDSLDSYGRSLDKAAELNPLIVPQAAAWSIAWAAQRATLVEAAAGPSRDLLRRHLEAGWDRELEPVKRRMLKELDEDSRRSGWGEAALRRMTSALELEFTDADLARIRALGLRIDMIYAVEDQFIPWPAERQILARLGIDAPEVLPPAGTVLRDASGLVSVRIVDGDHYLPLKRPGAFDRAVDP